MQQPDADTRYSRIILLGRGGAGKTRLARRLGKVLASPVLVLDEIWESDVPEFRERIVLAHAGNKWISDGNFAVASFDLRLPRATLIIWVDAPKLLCSWRALIRVLKGDETHRAKGLIKVWKFIWQFDRVNRPRIETHRLLHGPAVRVVELKSGRDVEAFLATLYPSGQ